MNDENTPPKLPEIDTPILMQEQKEASGATKGLVADEGKRLQAMDIICSLQNSAFEMQNSICSELQRAHEELQKTTVELEQKQKSLTSIYESISTLLMKLIASQENVQTLRQLLETLASSDSSTTNQIVQKVIERYEDDRKSNINNSINKVFDYNKYN